MIELDFTLPDGSPVEISLRVDPHRNTTSVLQGEFTLDSNVGLHLRLGRMLKVPWLSFLSSCCGAEAYTFQDGPGECSSCWRVCNAGHDAPLNAVAVPGQLAEVIALDPVTNLILGHEIYRALETFFTSPETHLAGQRKISLMGRHG